MTYTVTFNPALDYVMSTDNFTLGTTNRSQSEEIFFGGKGINVSCVLKELDVESTALGFIAGFTGDSLLGKLNAKGINTDFIRLKKGLTRINVKLSGKDGITEINANGPEIEKEDINKLFSKLDKIKSGDTLVLAGSIPKALPQDMYEQILSLLSGRNIKFVVDAEGKLLVNTLKYKPFLIKPNLDELSGIMGKVLKNEEEIIESAKELQAKGALNVLVTLGKDGAILLSPNGEIYKKTAFKIKAVNTVGAGDSMIAGFLAGLNKGFDYALNLGTASAAATAQSNGLAKREQILKFL